MEQQNTIQNKEYQHNKKLMLRYTNAYAAKTGEKPLKENAVEAILTAIISIIDAIRAHDPRTKAKALIELGHLVKKYGAPLVWKLYNNFRTRQRRKEQGKNKTIIPTAHGLQKLLSEHEIGATQSVKSMKQHLVAEAKKNVQQVAATKKSTQNAA